MGFSKRLWESVFFLLFHMSGISTAGFKLAARHTVLVNDREAIEGGLPVLDRHGPFFRDVPQGQVEQFEHGLVIRERAAGFGHFSQRHIQGLDGVGRVDHASNLRRMCEERDHAGPVRAPAFRDHRKFVIPLLGEFREPGFGL